MKEFFEWGKRILGVGQPQPGQPPAEQPQADEEQSRASGGTAQPGTEKGQTTGSSEPNSQQAGHEKNPARRKGSETTKRWNPEQGCLEVKTERVLELRSLSTVMIKLAKGEVLVLETDEVQQPKLTITERVYAGSKSEAIGFYKENGSGVNVSAGPESLYVKGESSSGVVSAGSRSVNVQGAGGVVIIGSNIRGSIYNTGYGNKVIINGQEIRSSQPAARRETRVVLRVPVANEGEKSEPEYIIEVDSGNIIVENGTGEYDISVDAGNIVIEACDMVESKITNEAGNIEVTDGRFIGENTVKTEAGGILIKFDRNQGKIKVQTIQPGLGRGAIQETIFFEGVENPNGQTARLILTTQAGEIEVNE